MARMRATRASPGPDPPHRRAFLEFVLQSDAVATLARRQRSAYDQPIARKSVMSHVAHFDETRTPPQQRSSLLWLALGVLAAGQLFAFWRVCRQRVSRGE